MLPKSNAAVHGAGHEIVLRPADQRRYQQRGKIEIIFRLNGETEGGEEVAHGKRCVQAKAIDACNGDAFLIEASNDQAG